VVDVLRWIREHTDHKDIRLYPVGRHKKAFRGAFRRIGIPAGKAYSHDFEIVSQVLYGEDLPQEWKRLVIVKEALHVFDPANHQVNTPEGVRRLIPAVITPELRAAAPFAPAIDDFLGAYKAMAVLLPRQARQRLKEAIDSGRRTSTEIADYAQLPDFYVGIWLEAADSVERDLCGIGPSIG
jgi:hypothetical protein